MKSQQADECVATYTALAGPLLIDGKPVVTAHNVDDFFFRWVYDPPVTYPEPTPYGSVARYAIEGWGVVVAPLAVGVHQISWSASQLFPADNGVFPYESGVIFNFSYTITVQH